MKYKSIFVFYIITLSGCGVFGDSDEIDPALFGQWYKLETIDNQTPAPDQRIQGWSISPESVWHESAMGSFHPIGINAEHGTISLIDTRYIADIHYADSEVIIADFFNHPETFKDTVQYRISGDQLILDGRYYNGTFQRTNIGSQVLAPLKSELVVTIDGKKSENIPISQNPPSAYISRISSEKIQISSTMNGERLALVISDFQGTGTYIIGKRHGNYYTFGTDWISPPYITQSDSSGTITFEQFDFEGNRYSGHFEFVASVEGTDEDPEFRKHFTNGVFVLPVFE